jgi:hypothetical protein
VLLDAIVGVSILFTVAWAYVIFDRPSFFSGAAGFSFSCPGVFVIRMPVVIRGEGNLVRMISWQILQPL